MLIFNRKCGKKGITLLSLLIITSCAFASILAFYEVINTPVTITIGNWLLLNNFSVAWEFSFNSLTICLLLPVVIVSVLVQLYSYYYMNEDPHLSRFYSYLSLFTFFMLILITGENLLVLFFGWEGVGLASYLLINFWFTRQAANMAALKAFLMNRMGDWALTIGILLTLLLIDDISLFTILSLSKDLNGNLIFLLTIFFLIGATAKSAQLGLHTWLASAMEGPTPVSALIHAATMVTAGVYLLLRLSPLLEWNDNSLMLITWLGGLSALFGASCGLFEQDLKKVIAYSTTSQLGYMFVAAGLSQYNLSLFHLFNHAFFKALLFLSAGAIIHSVASQQDLRKLGSLVLFLPITYSFFLVGSLSLMAFPFLTGFYSKDYLLQMLLASHSSVSNAQAYLLTMFAAFFTAIYSVRLIKLTFITRANFPKSLIHIIHETTSFPLMIPLFTLAFFAVYIGYFFNELFFAKNFFLESLFIHPNHLMILDPLFSEFSWLKSLPLLTLFIIFTIIPAKISKKTVYNNKRASNFFLSDNRNLLIHSNINGLIQPHHLSRFVSNDLNIYYYSIIYFFLKKTITIFRYWDLGLLQLFGPLGLIRFIHWFSFKLELFSTGLILHYAFIFMLFALTMILICLI